MIEIAEFASSPDVLDNSTDLFLNFEYSFYSSQIVSVAGQAILGICWKPTAARSRSVRSHCSSRAISQRGMSAKSAPRVNQPSIISQSIVSQ